MIVRYLIDKILKNPWEIKDFPKENSYSKV